MEDRGAPPPWLEERREAQRRGRNRRRRLILAAIAVVAAGAAVVLIAGGSGDRGGGGGGGGGGERTASTGQDRATNAETQPDWRPYHGPVPILMYHVIGTPAPDEPYPELWVAEADFKRQLRWLSEDGYEAVTLTQVEDAWDGDGELPPKPIVISFDDGYQGQYRFAFPRMKALGWPGLLSLKAEGADLYSEQVGEMIAAGWELAAHTINHLDLTTLDADSLRREVAGSRAILRRKYGVPVENFCYPSGEYDAVVVAAVEAAGYRGATTTDEGLAERGEPLTLERVRVDGSDGVEGLAAALSAAGG